MKERDDSIPPLQYKQQLLSTDEIMQDDFRDCDFLREVLIVFTSAIRQRGEPTTVCGILLCLYQVGINK